MSTFQGLEMAKKALFAQQSALYTTGHNISNANTEGYSRQRVNFEADTPFPVPAANRPGIPGQLGTGVKAGSVQRIRDEFLDLQFRGENARTGYWEKRTDALNRMENVMNELGDTGLSNSMNQLWEALNDLHVNPTDQGARSVVVQRAIALQDTFKYYDDSLTNIQNDLKVELDTLVGNNGSNSKGIVNDLIDGINDLNIQIESLEVHGYVTNDLYDSRDRLIDQLSEIIEIDYEYKDSSPYAKKEAQGIVTIKVSTDDGEIVLVDGKNKVVNHVFIEENNDGLVTAIGFGGEKDNYEGTITDFTQQKGSIFALIQVAGYMDNSENLSVPAGEFTEMKNILIDMQKVFVDAFNEVHESGYGLDGETKKAFFELTDDGLLKVHGDIIKNPNLIAAASADNFKSTDDGLGDGSNAQKLADVFKDSELTFDGKYDANDDLIENSGTKTSVIDYYKSVVGSLAVQVEEAGRMAENTGILKQQVQNNRDSVSMVSLDEEMTNMIQFQHAYNAAARSMTATDELLDRVINNMGLVGR